MTTTDQPDSKPEVPGADLSPRRIWIRTYRIYGIIFCVGILMSGIILVRSEVWWSGPIRLSVAFLVVIAAVALRHGFAFLSDVLLLVEQFRDGSLRLEAKLDETLAMLASRAPAPDVKAERLAEIRHAIRSASWLEAADLVRAFGESHPDTPEPVRASQELAEAKELARIETLEKIEAARGVNDPDRVIDLRDAIKPLLTSEALHELDRSLAKWFMTLIQRRLRTGKVQADVAILAAKVGTSLAETSEGASLFASLPTLRRAAGLCPRCALPYKGIADACPTCLAGSRVPGSPPLESAREEEDEENEGFPEILDRPT